MLSQYTPKPSRVAFIDEAYLKDTTPIFNNVDPKLLISAILVSQDKHMLQILGSGIYSELKTQISTNTLTSLNQSILQDYCQPIIAWFACVEALPNISMHIQNKGVEIKKSENSDAADIDSLLFLMQNYESTGKFYAKQLINYLRRNSELFPLYYNPGGNDGSNVDTIYGLSTSYICNLAFPSNSVLPDYLVGLKIGIDIL